MSEVGKAFLAGLGRPDPREPSGLKFPRWKQGTWDGLYREIGAGFYKDRFYCLFGKGVDRLSACLEAWSFIVPPSKGERMILGRNAYGAILVLDDVGEPEREQTCILDPLTVTWAEHDQAMFTNLLGRWLPEQDLYPPFHDHALYQQWRKESGEALGPDEILSIKVPLGGLGGQMKLSNFLVEDIFNYYKTTAPIFAKAKAQADAASKKKAARPKPRGQSTSSSRPKRR